MSSKKSESEVSLESIGFGSNIRPPNIDFSSLPKPIEFSISKLEPEGGSPSGEYVYNCIAFIIFCDKHQRIALSLNERSKAVWLPFIASPLNKTWNDATMDGISIIFSKEDSELDARLTTVIPVKSINCLHVLRIQLPITQKFVYRLIQLITLGSNTNVFKCCQSSKRLIWVELNDAISGNINGLWGPEVPIFSSFIVDLKQQEIFEYGLDQAYFYVSKSNSEKNPEEQMIHSANIGVKEVEKVYSEYLEYCFPSFFMTFASFTNYISEYWKIMESDPEISVQLFQAFNFNKNGYLSFHEFLLGVVSLEPNCVQNEARLKFIFRYYDLDQDSTLNEQEFGKLLQDLNLTMNEYRNLFPKGITWTGFNELINSGSLTNCSTLCRSQIPLIPKICESYLNRNENRITANKQNVSPSSNTKVKGVCLACRDKKYEFGSHCVRLDPTGRCVEPRHILEYDDSERDGEKTDEISVYKYSQDYVFSTVSIGHTFLDMIRDFNNDKGTSKKPVGFLSNSDLHDTFISYLNILCQNVRNLLECQSKVIKINSPAFVIGDIRGNLDELILMEKTLWQSVPVVPNNFVFLGNYVNVGKWSVECILYAFALKIIAPNKFFLLRGLNEMRATSKNSFNQECLTKYGHKNGQIVFQVISDVFDRMSLAVIIDDAVLCLNNVPPSTATIEEVNGISAELKDPLSETISREMFTNKYSEEAIAEFLKKNSLSHLIRGNSFLQDGFLISTNSKCITLFSSSKYCGKNNDSAVACVDHPKIRIVKLDTSKMQPSTDP